MFLDPFIFTPPRPEALTRAVESYQRVAAARFCRYARDAEDPDLLPLKVTGDTLEPTPKQLHAEIRALRHLTAIQRTLREIGGPLFDPASPIPPHERFHLVERRLDAIQEALGDDDDPAFAGESSNPVNLVNPVDSSSPPSPFFHPPEIEDLLEAVDFAQHVFAARAELLDKCRLQLSPEDFLLEISALRDLTAVIRTLRRMSAHRLPECQTHEDVRKEFSSSGPAPAPSSEIPNPKSEIPNPSPSHPSHPSYPSHDFPADSNPQPSHPSHSETRRSLGEGGPSPASSESVESVKSVDGSSSSPRVPPRPSRLSNASSDSSSSGLINSLGGDLRTRPVPRVPEVRTITPRSNGATPAPQPDPNDPVAPSAPASASAIPNPKSEIPNPPPPSASRISNPQSEIQNPKSEIPNSFPLPVLHDKDPPSGNSP